jgi:hypothetical protein
MEGASKASIITGWLVATCVDVGLYEFVEEIPREDGFEMEVAIKPIIPQIKKEKALNLANRLAILFVVKSLLNIRPKLKSNTHPGRSAIPSHS